MSKLLGVLVLSLGAMTAANAADTRLLVNHEPGHALDTKSDVAAAPEIDPASAMAAFTLLAGGLTVIRARRRSK